MGKGHPGKQDPDHLVHMGEVPKRTRWTQAPGGDPDPRVSGREAGWAHCPHGLLIPFPAPLGSPGPLGDTLYVSPPAPLPRRLSGRAARTLATQLFKPNKEET